MVLVGTRPEIVKMAPVIKLLENDARFQLILVNTGQHYDEELSSIFFDILQLPATQYDLGVGSGTHAVQTSKIMMAAEALFIKIRPAIVLAQGDTNTVMAAALAAVKAHVPFGHVEAGLRSFDRSMAEEINRIVTDHCSELLFAPTTQSAVNLLHEGCDPSTIHITGNTVVDSIMQYKNRAYRTSKIIERLNLKGQPFAVVTVHRPANVDDEKELTKIMSALLQLDDLKLVIPVHPRTQQSLRRIGLERKLKSASHIVLTQPLGYLDFLLLMAESRLIITDSGGLQEEAFTLGKPCVTLRTNTERPESIQVGANFLVGRSPERILKIVQRVLADTTLSDYIARQPNPFGDGHASERIIEVVASFSEEGLAFTPPILLKTGTCERILRNVDQDLVGVSVTEAEKALSGKIILIYDRDGRPVFPQPSYKLLANQHILLSFEA